MRRVGSVFALVAVALVASVSATAPATAASTGEVSVFGTEFEPVTTYENPEGCYKLPLSSHVLINRTDKPVQVFADPFCMTPSFTVQPGYGSHLAAGTGSFSA
ncbi:hypothetical protein [Streptomyces sp. NPDC053542]|uniref:hypothetical protein n=1 Tax=Streptomyces sp. NPDC053542 TaxID=3365710 RepID=UPI0037D1748C